MKPITINDIHRCLAGTHLCIYEVPKRRLAKILCPFCGAGDVWTGISADCKWYCQSCGKKFVIVNPEEGSFDTYSDIITNLLIKNGDTPLTAYDIKSEMGFDTDESDRNRVFNHPADAYIYLLSILGYIIVKNS